MKFDSRIQPIVGGTRFALNHRTLSYCLGEGNISFPFQLNQFQVFLDAILKDLPREKNKTGTPRNEGIKDVIELVELKEFVVNPQIIRNIP